MDPFQNVDHGAGVFGRIKPITHVRQTPQRQMAEPGYEDLRRRSRFRMQQNAGHRAGSAGLGGHASSSAAAPALAGGAVAGTSPFSDGGGSGGNLPGGGGSQAGVAPTQSGGARAPSTNPFVAPPGTSGTTQGGGTIWSAGTIVGPGGNPITPVPQPGGSYYVVGSGISIE